MTHTFKVGDTGLTRSGYKYRVVCDDVNKGSRGNMLLTLVDCDGVENSIGSWPDGKYTKGAENDYDLMPPEPPRQTFRGTFKDSHRLEFDAINHAGGYAQSKINNAFADYLDEQANK